jgi:mannose-1-phosphate guanylyltransferase
MPAPITTAFVLGAGLGTRLRPLTEDWPKPLLTLDGRPIITHAFDHLMEAGVRRFVVNTHHCAHRYDETFPGRVYKNARVTLRHEPVILDTAGGLKNIEDLVADEEHLFVYNGDIVTSLPLAPLMEEHFSKGNDVTLALRSEGMPRNVALGPDGLIADLRGRFGRNDLPHVLFSGVYIVRRSFFDFMTAGKIESVVEVFLRLIESKKGRVGGIVLDDGIWCDVGTIEEYDRMNRVMAEAARA